MSTLNPSKTERIDVRASTPVKQLLQEAARACHKNVSEFPLDAGVTAAAQTPADRRRFVLDEAQWQAFQEATDQVDALECGQASLSQFLQRYALVKQKANSAQTYVCCQGDVVVGFYSLAVGRIDVSLDRREARVTFDDTKSNVEALTRATGDAGFPATVVGAAN
jgi:uncharacterized protein (DUF1778 family)